MHPYALVVLPPPVKHGEGGIFVINPFILYLKSCHFVIYNEQQKENGHMYY